MFELLEARREYLVVQLREPGKFSRGFQVGVGKFAGTLFGNMPITAVLSVPVRDAAGGNRDGALRAAQRQQARNRRSNDCNVSLVIPSVPILHAHLKL